MLGRLRGFFLFFFPIYLLYDFESSLCITSLIFLMMMYFPFLLLCVWESTVLPIQGICRNLSGILSCRLCRSISVSALRTGLSLSMSALLSALLFWIWLKYSPKINMETEKPVKQALKHTDIYHWELLSSTGASGYFQGTIEAFWEFTFERVLTSSTSLQISHSFAANLHFTLLFAVMPAILLVKIQPCIVRKKIVCLVIKIM